MRFKSVEISGNRIDFEKQICFFGGIDSEDYLDALRQLIFDPDVGFWEIFGFITAEIEIDGRDFQARRVANVISNSKAQSKFAINFALDNGRYSADKTREYMRLCNEAKRNGSNVLCCRPKAADGNTLSESDIRLLVLMKFIEKLSVETKRGDMRPIFIYGIFDRVDEVVDIDPYIKLLASLGRQVFISMRHSVEIPIGSEKVQFKDTDMYVDWESEEVEDCERSEISDEYDDLPF